MKIFDKKLILEIIREELEKGKITFKVKGFSMLPTIFPNSTVFIKKINKIEKNKIYLFNFKNNLIIHRLVELDKNCYIFQGDSKNDEEKIKKTEDIVGIIYKVKFLNLISYNPNTKLNIFLFKLYEKVLKNFVLKYKKYLIAILKRLNFD